MLSIHCVPPLSARAFLCALCQDSMEESKVPNPSLIDSGNGGETADPHGDAGCGSIAQGVTQTQRSDDDQNQDWDKEVLNHTLTHILDKDKLDANATNKFAVFVIGNGFDDVCLLLTMLEDDFKLMGHDIDFKTF